MSKFRLAALFALILSIRAPGQEASPKPQAKPKAPEKPKEPPEFPPFDQITKKHEKVKTRDGSDGYYVLYRKGNRLLAEIPSGRLNKPFLVATSLSRGAFSGWPGHEMLVQWTRVEKNLLLIQPEVRYRAKAGDPLAESVKRTYTERVVLKAPIRTLSSSGGVVIDLWALTTRQARAFGTPFIGAVDPDASRLRKAKVFAQNVEVAVDLAAPSGRSSFFGSGGAVTTVHYSIRDLPATNYVPRLADDRVGYFLTAVKDYSKGYTDQSRFVRYVNRWRIEKRDSNLKVSPPKEPIVFYVEKTVPVRFRPYVHAGILEWNKAFEKVGIVGAIVVRQQETDNEFKDYDPEDAKYNFFRWITSDMAFAMGPSRVDPRTGQILDADIIFDDSMIHYSMMDHKILIHEAMRAERSPQMRKYFDAHPRRDPSRILSRRADEERAAAGPPLPQEPYDGVPGDGRRVCHLGQGMVRQLAIAHLAGLAGLLDDTKKKEWPEEFLGQVVKETVMHEVGHTLGLRHNFKASSWLSLKEINRKENPPEAISGSVMDYNPVNIAPKGQPQGRFVPTTIGPYDYWAIAYGYTPFGGGSSEQERPKLDEIAKRVAEKGLAYGTDEDVYGSSDPLINRWDIGNDPLAFANQRSQLVNQISAKLLDRAVAKGESYVKLRHAFGMLLSERFRNYHRLARNVGGHYMHRDHRGDPNERPPVVPVPVRIQRQSLKLLSANVFSDKPYNLSPDLLNKLGASRWYHWGSSDSSSTVEYPVHDQILSMQLWTLSQLTSPTTLGTLHDGELRVAANKDALTVPELFTTLTDAICSELLVKDPPKGKFTNRKPYVSSLRRNLQREYVAQLIELALDEYGGWTPRVAKTQAWWQLRRLQDGMTHQPNYDDYTRVHIEESLARIKKGLDAAFQVGGGSSSSGFFFFRTRKGSEKEE